MTRALPVLALALVLAGCPDEPEDPPRLDQPDMLVDTLPDTIPPGQREGELAPGPARPQIEQDPLLPDG
jgi:hypothetical protein